MIAKKGSLLSPVGEVNQPFSVPVAFADAFVEVQGGTISSSGDDRPKAVQENSSFPEYQ